MINLYKNDMKITVYQQTNQGPATARNQGAKLAKGQFIAFLDDDCEPTVSWLEVLAQYAQEGIILGGKTINKLEHNMYAEASQLLVSYLYNFFRNTPWLFFTSNNFLLDKKTFLMISGFDESFTSSAGEDREFCIRWSHLGYKLRYIPEAVIYHVHDLNLKSFWKQHFKYGRAAKLFREKLHLQGITMSFQGIFYIKLFKYPWQLFKYSFSQKCGLGILIMLSQTATILGYCYHKLLRK